MNQKQTNTRMIIGLIAIALAIGSLVITVPSLASAIFATGLNNQSGKNNLIALLTNHEDDLGTYLNRFEGRSMFFRPPPFPKESKPQPKKADPKPAEPIKTGPPSTYTGPKIQGVYGNVVWFKDNLKIGVGEEKSGVKVLINNAPWTVKIAHKGGEYDVPIFSDRLIESDEFSSELKLKAIPGITYEDSPTDSDNSGANVQRERMRQ